MTLTTPSTPVDRPRTQRLARAPMPASRATLAFRLALALALALALSVGAAPAQAQDAGDGEPDPPRELIWRGCEVSKLAFMAACARAYEDGTGVRIRLAGGGAELGIRAVAAGGADLGGTCRDCCRASERELPVRLTIVAWDAVAAVVHPRNPVHGLTSQQLRDVFTQKISDWKDLGGRPGRIVVVVRQGTKSGVGLMARRLVFGDQEARFGPRVLRLPRASGSVEGLVARQPRAIAFTGAASASQRELRMLAIDGVAPTAEHIASGRYPYVRPLYLATHRERGAQVEAFRTWLIGPRGQAVVAAQGTVPLERGLKLVQTYRHFPTAGPTVDNLADLRQRARARAAQEK